MASRSADSPSDWPCLVTVAELEKAKSRSGMQAEAVAASLNRMAQLPSPLRRCARSPNDEAAYPVATDGTAPASGSYRDQLRAKGQRALQLSQGTELAPRSPPPPPSAPLALDELIAHSAGHPPPPPTSDALLSDARPPSPFVGADGRVVAAAASLEQTPVAGPPLLVAVAPGSSPSLECRSPQILGPFCTTPPSMPHASTEELLDKTMAHLDREQLVALLRAAEPAHYED